jgi:hypothetical protein
VSFDELLAVLLGLVGRRLSVAIATAGEPPIMVGNMAGILRAGTELDAAGEAPRCSSSSRTARRVHPLELLARE